MFGLNVTKPDDADLAYRASLFSYRVSSSKQAVSAKAVIGHRMVSAPHGRQT
jgi:hypothetical protein